jgi:hypothetical protein
MHRSNVRAILSICAVLLLVPASVVRAQEAVDLNTWAAESYPAVSGFGAGNWVVAGDGQSVVQSVNGQPTFFYSDFGAMGSELEGVITPGGGDDDYIGFAVGFQPGDAMSADAEYLLIDWKGATQSYDFGTPSCTPGGTAPRGLAVSRVFGIPTADEFWTHGNFLAACSDGDNGLEQLARGNTLGDVSWQSGVDYTFKFQFSGTNLKVYVDDVLELDVSGDFSDGRFAFYNFSQANVSYRGFQKTPLVGPVAQCHDVTVVAEAGCSADANIDDGSHDPDQGEILLSQDPPGPYPVGETEVTLTVTDADELTAQCTATVTVTETVPPEITCPDDVTIQVAQGETVPAGDPRLSGFEASATDNCDAMPAVTDDAPGTFAAGTTAVTFTATDASGNSATCSASVTVTEAAPPSNVVLDIHPGSCVNPLQVRKQGVIPAAVLGSGDFDVHMIDVSSLLLEGVAPLRHGYEDVGTPPAPGADPCSCDDARPKDEEDEEDGDGIVDLTLKFPAPEVVAAISEAADGERRPLTLTGKLMDGTPFEAVDCMTIRANGNGNGRLGPPHGAEVSFTVLSQSAGRGLSIQYSLPEASPVTLSVYDVSGRLVERLVSSVMSAGTHTVTWTPDGVSNGIYFYRLDAAGRSLTRKAVLVR